METELSKFFLTETSRNGIPFNGIPFPFPFADRTNGIPQAVLHPQGLYGSIGQLTEMEI